MKPFSAMYFVRENRTRCFLLIFMLFLGYVAYLGGLYVTTDFRFVKSQVIPIAAQ